MEGGDFTNSVLIVSNTEQSIQFITQILSQNSCKEISVAQNCGEARRLLIERDFDLCIINAPLPDEFGDGFAINMISNNVSQVILIVRSELFDEVSAKVEDFGVFTIARPVSRGVFWSALKLANASYIKMMKLKQENEKLLQKIEDIRLINRAKCLLIECLGMSEGQAHKYIEKQAMNMRMTKTEIANSIMKTYSN